MFSTVVSRIHAEGLVSGFGLQIFGWDVRSESFESVRECNGNGVTVYTATDDSVMTF
jgi:hypothetical protein